MKNVGSLPDAPGGVKVFVIDDDLPQGEKMLLPNWPWYVWIVVGTGIGVALCTLTPVLEDFLNRLLMSDMEKHFGPGPYNQKVIDDWLPLIEYHYPERFGEAKAVAKAHKFKP